MECGCEIDFDGDNGPEAFSEKDRKARKTHICSECNRDIFPGETYRYESGIWNDGPNDYKTCTDCISVRDVYFCGFAFGEIWNDLWDRIEENDGEGFADSRISRVTSRGRDMICDLIEKAWRRQEDRESNF